MKTTLGAFVALLLAAAFCAQPAHAQRAPQGSYLNSCRNVAMDGDRLIADCRNPDGGWHRTALDIDRCAGDIANLGGRLSCNRGQHEGYGSSARADWREGYGSGRTEEWRDAQRARCWHILDPYERDRCWWGR
jgi:hypothetical protein